MKNDADYRLSIFRIIIGFVVLLIGALVYLADRPADNTYFVAESAVKISIYGFVPSLFGKIGEVLPSFSHAFAFIMITGGLLSCGRQGALMAAACWFTVDCAFELGQYYDSFAVKLVPVWLKGIPVFKNTENFFQKGVFDWADIAAILLGSIAAYMVLIKTLKKGAS